MSVKSPLTVIPPSLQPLSFPMTLAKVEYHYIVTILSLNGGNLTRTATILGISVNTLKRKIRNDQPIQY